MSKPSDYAAYNISQGKGFECPTCTAFVVAGYDCCPNCGEMPGIDIEYHPLQFESSGYFFWLIGLSIKYYLGIIPQLL